MAENDGRRPSGSVAPDVFVRLRRAREFLDNRYADPIDLKQASRVACLSPYHFLRMFRQAFGETPHQYLTRRRIDRARELLSFSQESITDICFEVGYESLGSFSTLFARMTGNPPLTYRSRVFIQKPLWVPSCYARMWGIRSPIRDK